MECACVMDGSWWMMCLLCLIFGLVSGSESECSDFLRMTPPSPSTVQLLKFSVQSLCGSAVSLHDDVPHHVWNPDLPTTVIIPGKRMARVQPAWVRTMAQELLAVGRENVLAVDWLVQPEVTLTAAAKQVGRKLARIIQQLLGLRSDPEMFHLIGFGVGAHIAGIAGSWLNGTVGRITGLDPFAPEFSAPNSSVYLDRADGQYVEIIHTNFNPTEPVPALGFSSPLGHIDYYVGLGFELPGCPSGLIKREDYLLCSHRRAQQIYTSSIRAPCRHFAFPCPSLDNFQHTLCTLCYQPGLTTCPEMGYNLTWLPTTRPPLFPPTTVFLTVAPSPPYCVTPLLLKLKMGGISSMEAKLYIQLEGNTNKTSTMLVSGKEIREFAANKNYEFLISSDSAGDFHTITLEFNTQRLLHLDWRKRTISIDHLLLSHLPLYKRKFYEAWNIAVVENRRVKVLLEEILV